MRASWSLPVSSRRCAFVALALAVAVLGAGVAYTQQAPAQQQPAAPSQVPTRILPADGAVILQYIKTDKAADFEAVMAKIKEGLQKSDSPERKQMATGWKVFKSPDPSGVDNATVFVMVIDPVVKGADYHPYRILLDSFPPEVAREFSTKYAESFVQGRGITTINLHLVSSFGQQ
jgi:hypothetical protein